MMQDRWQCRSTGEARGSERRGEDGNEKWMREEEAGGVKCVEYMNVAMFCRSRQRGVVVWS